MLLESCRAKRLRLSLESLAQERVDDGGERAVDGRVDRVSTGSFREAADIGVTIGRGAAG